MTDDPFVTVFADPDIFERLIPLTDDELDTWETLTRARKAEKRPGEYGSLALILRLIAEVRRLRARAPLADHVEVTGPGDTERRFIPTTKPPNPSA
ncbi:MAG TPA: hypothetical protein VK506_03560 [Conexibacter sp.]|nr:hypothetical protein [Conexibacter sp.]